MVDELQPKNHSESANMLAALVKAFMGINRMLRGKPNLTAIDVSVLRGSAKRRGISANKS